MNLDEAAKRLGYVDADHVERNIEAYGEPLPQWWEVIKELVNKLSLNDVSNCECKNLPEGDIAISSKALTDPNWKG